MDKAQRLNLINFLIVSMNRHYTRFFGAMKNPVHRWTGTFTLGWIRRSGASRQAECTDVPEHCREANEFQAPIEQKIIYLKTSYMSNPSPSLLTVRLSVSQVLRRRGLSCRFRGPLLVALSLSPPVL